jgi:alkylation response protein AidB-like acyl-CoA dehydrogenase
MNFDFSDDQKLLRDVARRFLQERGDARQVRRVLEGEMPFHAELWQGIAEMGWLGTAVPESYGGAGLGYLELCVLAEELGRSLAPTPFASTVYLAIEALLLAGTEDQKLRLLPGLAGGETIATLALAEGPQAPSEANTEVAVADGRIRGQKIAVPDGDVADLAVVAARAGDNGPVGLYLVDLKQPELERQPQKTVDPTRSHAAIRFKGAKAEPLGEAPATWATLTRLLDRAAILFAFEQLGGAQASLEMARAYAVERHAFGRPIASFQAIKHKLADMYIGIELARGHAYYGAWALSTDAAELPLAAAAARVSASDGFYFAAKENIQVHGGMGFTWEFDCHLYYRRAKLLALNLGSTRRWKHRLVTQLEGRNAA